MKNLIFRLNVFLLILLSTGGLFAIDRLDLKGLVSPGGAKNYIFSLMWVLVLIGLVSSFVVEVFKIQKSEKPDFLGVVWKSIIIILAIQFLPGFLDDLYGLIIVNPNSAQVDGSLNNLFNLVAKDQTYQGLYSKECDALMEEPSFLNITVKYFISKFWMFFLKIILLFFLVMAKIAKIVLLDMLWPIMFSISLYGFFSAIVFGSFPGGGGLKALVPFIKSSVTVALWPLVYVIGIGLLGNTIAESLDNVAKSIMCPALIYFGESFVKAVASCVFLTVFIKMIPKMSELIVSHQGVGMMAGMMMAAGAAQVARLGHLAGSAISGGAKAYSQGHGKGGGGGGGQKAAGGASGGSGSAGTGANTVSGLVGNAMKTGSGITAKQLNDTVGNPSGGKLKDGSRAYSYQQAQSLVDGVKTANPDVGKGFQKSLNRAQNMQGDNPNQTRAMRQNAVNSVAGDAIGYLTSGVGTGNNTGGNNE